MTYVLDGFGAGLRGEEVPLISLAGMLHFWEETRREDDPYIMVTMYGQSKGETGFRWHYLPISDCTRSGIPHRRWIGRLIHRRITVQGRSDGWLFWLAKGKKSRILDYAPDFVYYLG